MPRPIWTLTAGDTLAPGKPVTLTWANTKGVTFTRRSRSMRTSCSEVTDTVANNGHAEARLAPYGIIARHGLPLKLEGVYVVHEGPVSRIDGKTIVSRNTPTCPGLPFRRRQLAKATESLGDGWTGFTDHYWMTTLIPEQGKPFTA